MKRIVSIILLLIMIIPSLDVFAGDYVENFFIEYDGQIYKYNSRLVTLKLDGVEVETGDMPAIILKDRTLVPAREVFESEAFNATVDWNGTTQEIYITYKDKFIVLQIDNEIAYVNNQEIILDAPPKLIRDVSKTNAKTMIPLRFVTENLGYNIDWKESTYTAVVTSKENEELEESDITDEEEVVGTDEQLDEIGSSKANRELPTALADNPIQWGESLDNVEDTDENTNEITSKELDPVKITSVDFVDDEGTRMFVINADGPISSIKESKWNGKYIIDIVRGIYDLDDEDTTYQKTYEDNPIVYAVRSSQQAEDSKGNDVIRIVFDLKNGDADLKLAMSSDRKQLSLELIESQLSSVILAQNEKGDYIELDGTTTFIVEPFRLSEPDRIVFDIPNTVSLIGYNSKENLEGQYVNSIRTAQFDYTTTRVVVETDGQADYYVETTDDNRTIIQLIEPTYSNIKYENYDKPTIVLEDNNIDIDGITYEDNYRDREYIITLPGNYSEIFGVGDLQVNDGLIDSVEIIKEDDNTKIKIKSTSIYEYRIEQDDENIYLRAYKPKELYSKILVVDAGHGGTDPGAVANGAYEKTINLDIVKYMVNYLNQDESIKVYYTRLEDEYLSLQERVDLANEVEADIFLSVHNNAFKSTHSGTETLYYSNVRTSGLDSIELADVAQKYLVATLGLTDRGLKERPNLYVLKHTKMPAIIVECGFLTNTTDIAMINNPDVQGNIAKALYDAVVETFNKYPTGR